MWTILSEVNMAKNFVKLSLFLMLFAVLLAACGKKDMSIGRAENGGKVELTTGQTLIVSLDANPTTGYSWEIDSVDATFLKLKSDPEFVQPPDNGTPLMGAGGTQVFRFEALKAGEKDVPPINTYTLTMTVK
jgi:inhibitor of cysteine peptidase